LAAGVTLAAAAPLAAMAASPAGGLDVGHFTPALVLIALFGAVHLALCLFGRGADQVILPILLLLMGLGLAFNQRLAPALADRQEMWLVAGVVVLATSYFLPSDPRRLQRYRYTWALSGILLVALTLVAGRAAVAGGPRLWLGVGTFGFQPSEVLKLVLVFFLAGYLEDKRELLAEGAVRLGRLRLMPLPYLVPLGVMLGLSLALLAAQRDLGAALLLFAIALGMLYLASGRPAYVAGGLALFVAGAWTFYHYITIVRTRVAIWLDPWADPSDSGYQLIQGLLAIAAGGVSGAGIGQGEPTAVPAVHTDFIYAAVVEEIGMAGATAVLMLYLLLALRGFRAAARARAPFLQLLAGGLTFALAVQAFIIVGGVVKLIPLTGITLPFLSYGGTSMLTSAAAAGLVLRVSAEAPP